MRAVPRVLDLTEIFQFVKDGFNQRSSLEEGLIEWCMLDRLPIPAYLRDEVQLTRAQQINPPAGDISLVGIHLAK